MTELACGTAILLSYAIVGLGPKTDGETGGTDADRIPMACQERTGDTEGKRPDSPYNYSDLRIACHRFRGVLLKPPCKAPYSFGILLLAGLFLSLLGAAKRPARKTAIKPPMKSLPAGASASLPLPIEALGPPPASEPSDDAYKDADLVASFSSNWQAYLEPCGCVSGQYGGIARLATVLQEQSVGNPNQLPVFAGDFSLSASDEDRLKTDTFFTSLERMGFQGATIGEQEFLHGLPFLLSQIKKHPRLFVSANLFNAKTGKLLARPYLIREYPAIHNRPAGRKTIRVAITGFIGLREVPEAKALIKGDASKIRATDPSDVLPKLVKQLRSKADVIVVLAHSDAQEALDVARDSRDIDLMVVGHMAGIYLNEAPRVGKTTLVSNGDRGRYVAQAAMTLNPNDEATTVIRQFPLSATFPENAAIAKLRDAYKPKLAAMSGGTITAEEVSPVALLFPVSGENGYVGSDECATCHFAAYNQWRSSKHSQAYVTLQTLKKGINLNRPECVRCHTVGFGQATGFAIKTPDLKLAGVGCESCHGPGKLHIEAARAGQANPGKIFRGFKGADSSLCVRCHDPANDPHFNYSQYLPKIRHWGPGFSKT
jgi:hypothetical protein